MLAGICGLGWAERGSTFALVTGAATLATVLIISHCGGLKLAERESSKQLLELANARGYSQAIVYGLQRSDRTPEFYAAGRVAYDPDGEATKYEGVGQVVWESRRRQATILTFVPVKEVSQFTQLNSMRVEVVGSNGKYSPWRSDRCSEGLRTRHRDKAELMKIFGEEIYDRSIVPSPSSPVAEGKVKPVSGKSVFASRFDRFEKQAASDLVDSRR